jgi:4-diphosphocytidyl-2-C-methyl-D-erythritol kinase
VTRSVGIDAPAKVNLRLTVLGREASGYHALETIFCAVSLADRVQVADGDPGIDLRVVGDVATGPAEQNLAARAARRFHHGLGLEPACRILLRKRIPAAAGLGGGSSDAAATLKALNVLHGDPFDRATLLGWAAELGSDVPFFLGASTLAIARGRGERLLGVPPLPSRPLLIAHPGTAIPTAAAFARLDELRAPAHSPAPLPLLPADLASWPRIEALAANDFEVVARERVPTMDRALQHLRDAGARIALLAGSGSAVFGIFPEDRDPAPAERRLADLGWSTWRARSLEAWPEPETEPTPP